MMVLTFVLSQCFIVKLLTKPVLLRKIMQIRERNEEGMGRDRKKPPAHLAASPLATP